MEAAQHVGAVATSAAREEYAARLAARQSTVERLNSVDARVAYSRLAVFILFVGCALLAWRALISAWILLAPLGLFVALIVYHDRVLRARSAAERASTYYERGIARLEDRWIGTGEPGERFRDDSHLYANDLDLFGRGSLFELLSTARTRPGEATLAQWLKQPAAPSEIVGRSEAVRELSSAIDLREALSRAGADVAAGVHGDALVHWARGTPAVNLSLRGIPIALTTATLASGAWAAATGNAALLEIALVVQSFFAWTQRHHIERALHAADGPARDLDIVSHLLRQVEATRFESTRLRAVRQRLDTSGQPASMAIRSLHRLVAMHDWQHNLVFTIVGFLLLWGTHLAWAIEAWRARHGCHVATWLDAVAEVEALASLGAYHFEHPDNHFAEILFDRQPATFEARDLGHPLIPTARMVRNDVRLNASTRLLVVSGSNMSGKSTLLRSVGINAVLALAGAPVCARHLRISPVFIGATLRIQDSLQEGRSRFYAEISRIRELADLAATAPLLFLLDELFHGTNSHDRLVGASGVLRNLLDRGAIGLITTHDLALTAIADALAARAVNVHLEDWFEDGQLRFDYRVKPGPVTRSNAIALMRAVGLDVDDQGSTHTGEPSRAIRRDATETQS